MNDFSDTLLAAAKDDNLSADALLPQVYEELHRLACSHMAIQSPDHTLQPTALVHEAWLKMVREEDRTWQNRTHFMAVSATAMRHVLVAHARRKTRMKRGGERQRMDLEIRKLAEPAPDERILLVEDALVQLERVHPDWAQIVVMKYFGGMRNREVAESLEIGERTVERYWAAARAWLYNSMTKQI